MSALYLIRQSGFVYREAAVAFIGTLAQWMLYGILLVQICLYYTAFPNDPLFLKQIVLLALVFETIQTSLFTQDVFRGFTRGFNDTMLANEIGTIWFSVPLMTGLSAFLTQAFYCYRIALLTKSKCAVAVIAMLSILQIGSGVVTTIQTKEAMFISDVLESKSSLITVGIWGVSSAACDTTIAVIMVYQLKKRDTGFQETRNIVKRLIRLTIETGFITASFSTITVALAYIPGDPPYYQIGILILAKLYSNSMIAALNGRMKVVSNSPAGSSPSWNESAEPVESWQRKTTQDLAFFKDESVNTTENAV